MENKPIPKINLDFDLGLLLLILRKNVLWIVLFAIIGIISTFLIIRYTNPVFLSRAEIQLTNEESANSILRDGMVGLPEENLAKEIELLRSPVFINRVAHKLPMEVSYFNDGRFLDYEAYGNEYYQVDFNIRNPNLYGKKFMLDINADKHFELTHPLTKNVFNGKFGELIQLDDIELLLHLPNGSIQEGKYYFIINDSTAIVKSIIANLQVTILNSAAKTIEISFKDHNNKKAADVVNAIASEFEQFHLEKKQDGANKIISFIDNALVLVTEQLTQTDEEMNKNFAQIEVNPFFQEQKSQMESDKIFNYQNQLLALKKEMDAIKALKSQKIEGMNDVIEIRAIISGTSLEKYLDTYLNSIQSTFQKKEELRYSAPEGSPLLESIHFTLKSQINAFENSLSSVEKITRTKYDDTANNLTLAKSSIPWYQTTANDSNSIDFTKLKRLRSVNEKYFNQLIEKRAEMVFLREGITPEYQILAFGAIPQSPLFPNERNIIAIAIFLWLFFSLALIGLRYIFNDEILSVADVVKYTNASILGVIHKYEEVIPVSQLVVDKNPKGLMSEAFRALRTNMAFINSRVDKKIISITSTISGEGKTFVSINLSGIIAYSKAKVILIDCDMRKPKIHVGFGVSNNKGMSTLLTNQSSLEESIHKSSMPNLDFITAGPPPPNPSELLLSEEMEKLLKKLHEEYDYIVIDNPPAGIVSDAIINMKRAHYPIYVVRSSYSRKYFINNINHLLLDNKINNLSVVINGLDLSSNSGYGFGLTQHGYGVYTYGADSNNGFGYYTEEDSLKRKGVPIMRRIFGRKK